MELENARFRANSKPNAEQGVALLAVLWLTVALTVIGMTTAAMVRNEADAVSNHGESERAYYLARGGIDAAIYSITHSKTEPAQSAVAQEEFRPGQRWLVFPFTDGTAVVEVAPESAKLSANQAPAEQLEALFSTLGESADASRALAAAVVDWRSTQSSSISSPFDPFYAGLAKPYSARHAALQSLDELLAVKGMSSDLFFGRLTQTPEGTWTRMPPIADLLTTETGLPGVNLNYAAEQVLEVQPGWDRALAESVVRARKLKPFASIEQMSQSFPELARVTALAPVSLALYPVYTLTATAWVNGSSVKRTVRARVRLDPYLPLSHMILAWWSDWPWSAAPPVLATPAAAREGAS